MTGSPHVMIRASAGTGKTYRLSSRYLELLRGGVGPGTILATTFTRKAAGEVLARVMTRLTSAITDKTKREELSKSVGGAPLKPGDCVGMLRGLTASMDRLSISTIDGFFSRITRCFSHELDLPAEPVLVDESHPSVKQLRLDAIEAMLGDDDLSELVLLLRQFHHDQAARSVTEALDGIICEAYEVYREAPRREVWDRLEPEGFLDQADLERAIQALRDAAGTFADQKTWNNAYQDHLSAAQLGRWESFLKTGIAKKLCEGAEVFNRKPIDGPIRSALDDLIRHAKAYLVTRVATQTLATHDIIRRFDTHYTALRRRHGLVLFSDLTHKLARELPALGDGLAEDIYFRLDGRVSHLLLDEFQDTSLAQWDVLRPIAQEIAATADDGRGVFVVGDTKQAIYGWRGGVAELFDEAQSQLGIPDDGVEKMDTSYRSSGVVLDVVNRVFGGLDGVSVLADDAASVEGWQSGFAEHDPAYERPGHATLETSGAGFNLDDDAEDDSGRDDDKVLTIKPAHESYVAQRVKALYERDGGAGSIGVLVSTNDTAARLIHEIGVLGLPVSGEGGGWLTDSPAVSAVLSALVMADHPGETASVFHVFNSPLAGVVGLEAVKDRPHVQRVALGIRKMLLARGYARTLADWTRAVADDCDARGLTRLTQLIGLADKFDAGDALRPSRFVAFAESQRVSEPSPAAIRVMTVHGSKGLEFDTVVLAELDKAFKDRTPLLIERKHATEKIDGVYRYASKLVRGMDENLGRAYGQHRASRMRDWLCGLYVGMTRARHALHMIVKPRGLKKDGSFTSPGLRYASVLRETLCVDVEESADGEQVLFEGGDAGWKLRGAKPQAAVDAGDQAVGEARLCEGAAGSRRFWPTVAPSSRAGGERTAASLLDIGRDSAGAMRYGTMVHAWMERVGFIGEDALPAEAGLRRLAARWMPGMTGEKLDERLAWYYGLLKGPNAQRLLSRGETAALWRERAFMVRDGKELMRGCFDRVNIYTDAGGRVTGADLLDYKTDSVGPEGVGPIAEHYLPQMRAYRRALSGMLGIKGGSVRMRLWFVGVDEVVDLAD